MQLSNLMFALVAVGASLGLAAPSPEKGSTETTQWTCPNGWSVCGECNGTSCKIAASNWDCEVGSCVGDGGGDGAICGNHPGGKIICPGSG
ncbi:hypothetical protein N7532_011914 [Penicillium argentinense]|uniref:Uncharacterized protein n=1 Tax=Penicillium argentinense TaxID=1131581 RepID=A0A9W9EJL0_9EURO|nr:uncharacterized protein N7532_011914 [Penicillium argentinense]KAJ5082871.1 hypothetical protein N7532_011914 [Penicillium argentinense]